MSEETNEQIEDVSPESQLNEEVSEEVAEGNEEEVKEESESERKLFKRTVKVNGKEREVELDLNDEEKLVAMIQKGLAADEKFLTASQKEKQARDLEAQLEKMDPDEVLKKRGMNPVEWAEQVLLRAIEESEMTDEQKELRQLKAEKEQRENQEKPIREQMTEFLKASGYSAKDLEGKSLKELDGMAIQAKQERDQVRQSLDQEITEAWKDSGLPMEKPFVLAISQEMYGAALRNEPMSAKDAAEVVKDNWYSNVKNTLSSMDAKAIQEVLGEDIIKALKKADIERVSGQDLARINTKSNRPPRGASERKPMTEKEWSEHMENLKRQFGAS